MSAAIAVLRVLAARRVVLTRQIAADVDMTAEYVRQVCAHLARHAFIKSAEGVHEITEKGAEALRTGKIQHLRKGTAAVSHSKTLRQKAWWHMRAQCGGGTFTVQSLLSIAANGHEKYAKDNLHKYCQALYKVGILGKSARSKAYYLKTDTGRLAPTWNKRTKTVTDRNTGEVHSYE